MEGPEPGVVYGFNPLSPQAMTRDWQLRGVDAPTLPSGPVTIASLMRAASDGNLSLVAYHLTFEHIRRQINTPDHLGATALAAAAWRNADFCVAALANARANPNIPLRDGRTPLHLAAYYGKTEAVKRLLQTPGIAVNALNVPQLPRSEGNNLFSTNALLMGTPLHFALEKKRTEIAHTLLMAGGDPRSPSPAGENALHIAAKTGNAQAIQLVLEAVRTQLGADRPGDGPARVGDGPGLVREVVKINRASRARVEVEDNGAGGRADENEQPDAVAASHAHQAADGTGTG